jgi:hypothetical protein
VTVDPKGEMNIEQLKLQFYQTSLRFEGPGLTSFAQWAIFIQEKT